MDGVQNVIRPGIAVEGLDWSRLPPRSTIIDVGGGVGTQSLLFARAFAHLNFIIQDKPATIMAAEKFWRNQMPDALSSGRVKLQEHDFLQPQPVRRPAVFFVRMILHDWSDDACVTILRHLRAAAAPDTQLVIADTVYPEPSSSFPGVISRPTPASLFSAIGFSADSALTDLSAMGNHSVVERTLSQFAKILEASGWRISRLHQSIGLETKIFAMPLDESRMLA